MALLTPYSQSFSSPLQANRRIGIDGVFKKDGNSFTVMLLCDGDHEMADAFILESDGDRGLIFSIRKDGERVHHEQAGEAVLRGKKFKLFIEPGTQRFKVTLDEAPMRHYDYHFPLKMVKHIWIDGDINLTKVTLPD